MGWAAASELPGMPELESCVQSVDVHDGGLDSHDHQLDATKRARDDPGVARRGIDHNVVETASDAPNLAMQVGDRHSHHREGELACRLAPTEGRTLRVGVDKEDQTLKASA